MIRPQQQKQKKQKEFAQSLKKGDMVVTVGGMHGKVVSADDSTIMVEIDKGVKVKLDKNSVSFENTSLHQKS